MDTLSLSQILIPLGIGGLAMFIYAQVMARREIEKRKKGYKPSIYQNKLPSEYSKKERKFTLIIGGFILLTSLLALYLVMNQQIATAHFLILLGFMVWGILIKVGNRIK